MPVITTPRGWPAILSAMLKTNLEGRRELVKNMTEAQREGIGYLYRNEVERRRYVR